MGIDHKQQNQTLSLIYLIARTYGKKINIAGVDHSKNIMNCCNTFFSLITATVL